MKNGLTSLRACLIFIVLTLGSYTKLFAQPQANFTASPVSGCSPIVVNFMDQSTGSPTQWRWDLGNGVISFLQNPSATYFNPGTYNVKLVATNASGSDSIIKNQYITVYANPVVDFTASDSAGCFPLAVQFTSLATAGSGVITNYNWDFGDGAFSTLANPTHSYISAGIFTVTLRVTNSFGCIKTFSKTNLIQIGGGVLADFTNSTPGLCSAPATINFLNASTGPGPLSYTWDFGDGNGSVLTSPVHTYNTTGSFTVSLIAVSPLGCRDTVIKSNLISIGNIASQFTSPDTVCAGTNFNIINTTTPTPVSVQWDFGDGTTSTQISPVKSYLTAGTYTIKLVNFFGACSDSISKSIVVKTSPTAAFSANQTTGCMTPFAVNFSNLSTTSTSWSWDFGDGATASAQNPSHVYTAPGAYTVTLIAFNSNGCSDTIVMPQFIQIVIPSITINGLPQTGCLPLTISPTATVVANQPIAGYLWNFGDGATSTAANPSHIYSVAGTYNVSLIITTTGGCTDTAVITNAVTVGQKPAAAFSATPTDVCAFQQVQFTDHSTGSVDQWLWQFGDGGTDSSQNPSHIFSDTGFFSVTLIVWSNSCPDTITLTNVVHVKPPIAAFLTNSSCVDKFKKDFVDQSIGATSWQWDFGDGNSSISQSPSHSYAATGTYTVKLTVTNGSCSHSMQQMVRVVDEQGTMSADNNPVCKNTIVNFTANNINAANISSWQWDFGDGITAGSPTNASHSYTASGNYTASLVITDVLGCSDTMITAVTVYGPTSSFISNVPAACLGNSTVLFTDGSTSDGIHPIIKWTWNFGDGTIDSTSPPPYSHTYAASGVYVVTLTVKDNYGCTDLFTIPTSIVIAQPKANFDSPDTVSCVGKPIQFNNTSTGSNLQYQWQFGDGSQDVVLNPIHNYSAIGLYTVSLSIIDQYGCTDTITKNNYIDISIPHALFTISDSTSTCPPLLVNYTNSSTGYTTLLWDFGDGNTSTINNPSHYYTYPGVLHPKLTITGPGGCTDTMSKSIQISGPQGTFSYTAQIACQPTTITFTAHTQNNVSFIWDFSDGNTIATTDSVVSHVYTIAGDFVPKVILVDASGCSVPIFGATTITVMAVDVNFHPDIHLFCDSGSVNFQNNTVSNDLITNYAWDFGDGTTSNLQQPTHQYNLPGIYTVKLFANTQQGCSDSLTLTDTVRVQASPHIAILGDTAACTPALINFSGNILNGSLLNWQWNFGNGQTATVQNPLSQSYTTPAIYNVLCKVVDNYGCKDSVVKAVNIHPLPNINAGTDVKICQGSSTQLNATGANAYLWSPGIGLSSTTIANPIAWPTDTTTYTVRGTTQFGCVKTDSVTINVRQPFALTVSQGDSLCVGESAQISAGGADQYIWSPATGLDHPNNASTKATPVTTTQYKVVAKDNDNCFTDTAAVLIIVSPLPTVNACNDLTISAGTPGQLHAAGSADVTNWNWTPQYQLTCLNCPNPKANPRQTTTYTVTAKNAAGCTSQDQVTVFVTCDKGNLFIPNTFSPNGDGSNDRFYPRGTGIGIIRSLRVFNRWGELIYEKVNFNANDASAGWDGTYKGQKLSPDVFVYTCEVVCSNNNILLFKGDITLIQ
jgi:gliding motility-associated-like protein